MADTFKNIAKTGGDYATIALWEAAGDVSSGRWVGTITDDEDYHDEGVTIGGSTGTDDKDNFVWLRNTDRDIPTGKTGTGHPRISDDNGGHVLTVTDSFVVIEGVEIVQSGTGNSDECIRLNGQNLLLSRCILRATNATTNQDGLYLNDAVSAHVDNCLFYGFGRAGIHMQNDTGSGTATVNIDYCGAYNCGTANTDSAPGCYSSERVSGTNNLNVYNTWGGDVVGGTGTDGVYNDYGSGGASTWAGDKNIADDTSCETLFTNSFDSVTFTDTNPASGENVHATSISGRDFNLVDEDTETVTQNGSDRTGSEPATQTTDGTTKLQNFGTDLAGTTRSGFSIGPLEFVSGGGQTITPSGLASAEAFGTAALTTGAVSVSPSGLASAEAFGTAAISGLVTVSPSAIASGEAFGTAALTTGAVTVTPTGIAGAEAFGTAVLSQGLLLQPSAIASAEVFGTATLAPGGVLILAVAIESGEVFGTASLSFSQVISAAGISSAEAFGVTVVGDTVVVDCLTGAIVFPLTKAITHTITDC